MATRYFGLVMILVVISFVLAGSAGDNADVEWGDEVLGCRISANASNTRYHAGEPIDVSVLVKNFGTEKKHLVRSEQYLVYRVTVLNQKGEQAPLTPKGQQRADRNRPLTIATVPLSAGESTSDQFEGINDFYDLSIPGTYTIVFQRSVYSAEGSEAKSVRSNRLSVEIVSAATSRPAVQTPETDPS